MLKSSPIRKNNYRKIAKACILSFAISSTIFAQESENIEDVICKAPSIREISESIAESARIKEQIKNEARKNANERISQIELRGLLKKIRMFFKSEKIYNQEVIRAASKIFADFEEDIISEPYVLEIKELLKKAIEESSVNGETQLEMKQQVNQTEVLSYLEYMERVKATDKYLPQLFRSHCGLNGMRVNAFATKIKRKPVVLICPGLIIDTNLKRSSETLIKSVSLVLAHELGHHIDRGDFKNAYENSLNCWGKNFGKDLNRTNGILCYKTKQPCQDKLTSRLAPKLNRCAELRSKCENGTKILCKSREKSCIKMKSVIPKIKYKTCLKNVGDKCYHRVAKNHFNEIISDVWASKVVASLIEKNNLSQQESREVLKDNFQILCGSGDEGIHASGDFRLKEIFGRNEKIAESIGIFQEEKDIKSCFMSR